MIFIFNYEREEMLTQILNQLHREKPVVIDDGSSYFIDYPNVIRFAHGGKREFWKKWFIAFEMAKGSDDDFFLFMPNDFLNLDMKRIKQLHDQFKDSPYVYNIINDGRDSCWVPFKAIQHDENTVRVGFTDCGFFCNRSALESIKWTIAPIPLQRFVKRADISSGVGQQLTVKFTRARVPMYKPVKSLAFHGEHESTMHKEHRKDVKLISR